MNKYNIAKANQLIDQYIRSESSGDSFGQSYIKKHENRFRKTIEFIPEGSRALEVGATSLFQNILKNVYEYKTVYALSFSEKIEEKAYLKKYSIYDNESFNKTYSIDIESEILPFCDKSIDFVMCCEVIEHLDVDPMFMMYEFNRILSDNGKVLITTPNSCSARNLWKIINGYRPHFFTQYLIDRSPYRHNFEYDVHALNSLVSAAGFRTIRMETHDVFEARHNDAYELIKNHKFYDAHRGDDIFLLIEKMSEPIERYPADIYA